MDTTITKPSEQQTNIEATRWKSQAFRKMMVKKVTEAIVASLGVTLPNSLSGLVKNVERFEEKVYTVAKDEVDYTAMLSAKVKAIQSRAKIAESNACLSNSSRIDEPFPAQEAGKSASTEWKEQVYLEVQRIKSTYSEKLNALYHQINRKLQQIESSQETKIYDLDKLRKNKRFLEFVFGLLKVSKSQISIEFKEKLDKAEKLIQSIVSPNNAPSHHQGQQHSADVVSREQSVPSHSSISQVETLEAKPSQKALGTQNYHMTKEITHKAIPISDEPSPAMQHFLKVYTSISPEALRTAVGAIREIVNLNDAIPTSELMGPPKSVTGTNLASDIDACSHARFMTCDSFVPAVRKMSRNINAKAVDTSRICASVCDSFNQLTDAEKPDLTTVTSMSKRPRIVAKDSLLEEIKRINNQLIDSEVVICGKDDIQSAAGEVSEHGEGLVVKLVFNAVTVNLNLISHLAADKKSIIKPIRLLVPASYPLFSPIILENMPLEVSEDLGDLSTIAKSKLSFSLQNMGHPWSLRDVASTWERCARQTIVEYAKGTGGGTFSSKYGGWEVC